MPHLNIDPIVCAAAVVQSLQTVVSRNTDPLDSVVLSINLIQGGSPVNLVVDQVMMKGTVAARFLLFGVLLHSVIYFAIYTYSVAPVIFQC